MLLRDLDQHDAQIVRIGDPHLEQAPRFLDRATDDRDAEPFQTSILDVEIAHLQPHADVAEPASLRISGDLQEATTEEEHHSGIGRIAEFPVNGQAESVAIEPYG